MVIIKIIRKNKIVETELVYFDDTPPVDMPQSIGQLILAVISNLHLYSSSSSSSSDF